MFKKHLYTSLILFYIVFIAAAYNTQAAITPTFPSCLNPQGNVKVENKTGTHGVPGDTNTYTGIDTVYYLTEDTLTQCLCPTNGNAIQTNWWNVKDLTQDEIDSYKNQGWIYIPDGSAWGLTSNPYLAQNIKYSCVGGSGGGGNGGSGGSSEGSSNNSSSGGQGGGSANATASNILSLASTGNVITLYLIFIIGISLLISGIYIRRVHPNQHE